MCKNSYRKLNNKTAKQMIYCHCFEEKENEMEKLCLFQRYCREKDEYVFNDKEEQCKNYRE